MLETQFGWYGIVAEPAQSWHDSLRGARACVVDPRCVWSRSGDQVEFNEVTQPEFSTVARYSAADRHSAKREKGRRYLVETVSLSDLLQQNNAPRQIDYLSIDTEGSELEILRAFDFDLMKFSGLITVEHNYGKDRDEINRLLQSGGFTRKFPAASLWDDWYVRVGRQPSGR